MRLTVRFLANPKTTPTMFQLLFDAIALMASFFGYILVRKFLLGVEIHLDLPAEQAYVVYASGCAALAGAWMLMLWFGGYYSDWYNKSPFAEYAGIAKVTFAGCAMLLVVIFFEDDASASSIPSRLQVFAYWIVLLVFLITGRLAARSVQRRLRERGIISLKTLVVGHATRVNALLHAVSSAPAWGYRVTGIGVVNADPADVVEHVPSQHIPIEKMDVDNGLDGFTKSIDTLQPDVVLVSLDNPSHDSLLSLSSLCDERGILVKIVPDLYEIFSGQARTNQIYGTPLIEVSPRLMKPWEEAAKRLLDIVVSILVLIVGAPVWIVSAIAVKLDSSGPAIFKQERCGRDGKVFTLYKFRSMTTDAEKSGPQWATMNDPRVTKIGKFIRKTHIDEVPQFWNVLLGEMSLVGPRPERPYYVEKFTRDIPYYPRRLRVRPGITGWHQVKYTTYSETLDDVRDRLRFDFFYIENMSFRLDLEILVRTFFRVLKGHGQA